MTAASASLWERDAESPPSTRAIDDLCVDRASSGSLLMFSGEAGIGKTALLAETRRIAEERRLHGVVGTRRRDRHVRPLQRRTATAAARVWSLMPEEIREYLGDWYDIAGPALGLAEPGDGPADPQGVCDGLVAVVTTGSPGVTGRSSCSSTTPTGPTRRPCAGWPRSSIA